MKINSLRLLVASIAITLALSYSKIITLGHFTPLILAIVLFILIYLLVRKNRQK